MFFRASLLDFAFILVGILWLIKGLIEDYLRPIGLKASLKIGKLSFFSTSSPIEGF